MVVNTSETSGTEQQKYLLLHYEYGRNCSDTYVSHPLAYIFPIHRKKILIKIICPTAYFCIFVF